MVSFPFVVKKLDLLLSPLLQIFAIFFFPLKIPYFATHKMIGQFCGWLIMTSLVGPTKSFLYLQQRPSTQLIAFSRVVLSVTGALKEVRNQAIT